MPFAMVSMSVPKGPCVECLVPRMILWGGVEHLAGSLVGGFQIIERAPLKEKEGPWPVPHLFLAHEGNSLLCHVLLTVLTQNPKQQVYLI